MKIGIVGCGDISKTYLSNAKLFRGIKVDACADLVPELAHIRAKEFDIRSLSVDALLADNEIDLVLNLTVPAAHAEVSMQALCADKHVFTEKPLATNVADGRALAEEAQRRGLLLGSAPDTFMGAAGRKARALLDSGAVGRPVTGTAFMFGRGMEHWHPNPAFYYQPGGGPLFDMGPYYLTMLVNLLGPVKNVQAMTTQADEVRLITADGPLKNTSFKVATPTTIQAVLEFRTGVIIQLGVSWDVFRHSNACMEIHGTEGSLQLPDPDTFGGCVSLSLRGEPWVENHTQNAVFGGYNWPYDAPDRANYRMLGVAELARSNKAGCAPRASAWLMLHILDIMESVLRSGKEGVTITLSTDTMRPLALTDEDAAQLLA